MRSRGPSRPPLKGKVISKLGRSYLDAAALQEDQFEQPKELGKFGWAIAVGVRHYGAISGR